MQSGSCVTPFKRGTDFTSRLVEISVEIGVEVNSLRLDWVMLKLGFDRIDLYTRNTLFIVVLAQLCNPLCQSFSNFNRRESVLFFNTRVRLKIVIYIYLKAVERFETCYIRKRTENQ